MADIFPFVPRVVAGEVMSFLTDIRKTPTGEARDSLRAGRRILRMDFSLDDSQNAMAESMFRLGAVNDWLVPVWPEITHYPVPRPVGTLEFTVEYPSDYVVGGMAILRLGEFIYEQAEVVTVGATSVTIKFASTIEADAIVPLKAAYITGDLSGARWFSGHAVRKLEFEFRDTDDVAETPFAQYFGADLMADPSVIASPIDVKLSRERAFIDNASGPVVAEVMRDLIDGMTQIVHKDFGRADMVRRKRWFRHIRGRDRSFWLPTWGQDFSLLAPVLAGQSYIDVAAQYGDPINLVGQHILVDDGAGYFPRLVLAAAVTGGGWRLSIAPLGRDVSADAVVMSLRRMRFDADLIEMTLTGAHYMETRVPAVEVLE